MTEALTPQELAQRQLDAAEVTAGALTEISSTLQNIELLLTDLLEMQRAEEENE